MKSNLECSLHLYNSIDLLKIKLKLLGVLFSFKFKPLPPFVQQSTLLAPFLQQYFPTPPLGH